MMNLYQENMRRMNQLHWDKYFLKIAETVSTNSKCLSRQIGAILVREKSIVATGYNGPARGIPHCGEVFSPDHISHPANDDPASRRVCVPGSKVLSSICPRRALGYKSGEGLHLCPAAHAERNAIANAALNGVCTKGCTLYMNTVFPCKDCLAELINAGVETIVVNKEGFYDLLSKWMFKQSDIELRVIKEET